MSSAGTHILPHTGVLPVAIASTTWIRDIIHNGLTAYIENISLSLSANSESNAPEFLEIIK